MNEVLRPGCINLWAIPNEFITQELCILAVMDDIDNIEFIPDRFKTKELFDVIMKNDDHYEYIKIIPKEYMTEEYILKGLLNNAMEYFDEVMYYIKPDVLTDKIREIIMDNLDKFPTTKNEYLGDGDYDETKTYLVDVFGEEAFTEEFCAQIMDMNPEYMLNIPNKFRTVDMYKKFVRSCGCNRTLCWPRELFEDDEFCDIVITQCEANKPFAYILCKRVPKEKISKERWLNLVNNDHFMFEAIPDEYKTVEMCRNIVDKWPLGITYVPRHILDENPDIWRCAIADNLKVYRYLPDYIANSEECKGLVKSVIDEAVEDIKKYNEE